MRYGGVQVGVAVFVLRHGRFAMGRRLGGHGPGSWSVPGGHVEYGEALESAAAREVREETGLEMHEPRFVALTNDVFAAAHKHYVTVWLSGAYRRGHLRVTEPDKFGDTGWYDLDHLPQPLFAPWAALLASPFMAELRARCAGTTSDPDGG